MISVGSKLGNRFPALVCASRGSLARCSTSVEAHGQHEPRSTGQDAAPPAAPGADSGGVQGRLARAYLRRFVTARQRGEIKEAIRYLGRAQTLAEHVLIKLDDHAGFAPGGLAPLPVIIPAFTSEKALHLRHSAILPFTVDEKWMPQVNRSMDTRFASPAALGPLEAR
mmetsp:Transcript_42887/g.96834  ORF Transcript_42887/g.96834 Transcript_42887/m.96834 type:complete len:168 (-) Transcript_42887:68-571(-)